MAGILSTRMAVTYQQSEGSEAAAGVARRRFGKIEKFS